MTLTGAKRIIASTYRDVLKNQTAQAAAALSYYSILSIFPALILLSTVMAHIPLPDFFADVLVALGRVTPPGAMPVVDAVLNDILRKNSVGWLSFATLGTIWVLSSAFEEMIEALDEAYDVRIERPFWKSRLLAIGLAAITGFFLMCTIAALVLGPKAIGWLAGKLLLSSTFVFLWPFAHWALAVGFTVLAVQIIYFLAPKVKHRFAATLPGALLAVACWIGLSHLLTIYFKYFSNYNRTYGTLGGVMVLITWLYWVYLILLAGGELNAEIEKERLSSKLVEPSTIVDRSGIAA